MDQNNSCKLTDKELEKVIELLETADLNHYRWLKRVHTSIICKQPFEKDVLSPVAHTCCQFGTWYYNNAPELIRHRPEFIDLDGLHKAMHDSARELAIEHMEGHEIRQLQYASFIDSQRTFSKSLLNLRDQLRESLHSFDSLTGLMTRGPFAQILNAESSRSERQQEPCCLILLDIDHFKQINDKYGHLAGDRVLSSVAQYMLSKMRIYDSICRYGGEEFLICLPMTSLHQAHDIMDRLRNELEELAIEYEPEKKLNIAVSIGIATIIAGEGYETCLKNADEALYEAKRSGRNRVCVHPLTG